MILPRNIRPGGHVGCFQLDRHIVLIGKEQGHLRQQFPYGEVIHEGLDNKTANVSDGGQWPLTIKAVFRCADLIHNGTVDSLRVARP